MKKKIDIDSLPADVKLAALMTGLNYKQPKTVDGKKVYRPWRNHWSAISGSHADMILAEMTKMGLAERGCRFKDGSIYRLTEAGMEWLGERLGIRILPMDNRRPIEEALMRSGR